MRCHDKGGASDTTHNIHYLCKLEITELVLFVHSCYCIIMGKKQTIIGI